MNKSFTKKIELVLVFALSFCSIPTTFASSENVSNLGDDVIEAMEVLRLFSIIPDYYDYSVDETAKVSRADFVSGVAKMLGLTTYDGATYYYDVSENHWAFVEVNALTRLGILSGVGNKLFRPDEPITKNEGYKIIMSVLGYGEWAQYNGGYPRGYLDAARRAMVSIGVSSDEYITIPDMMLIFYNAITASVLEGTTFNGDDVTYSAKEGNTLLSIFRDIYYGEGVMTGAEQISFEGKSILDGQFLINGIIYESDVDISQYLGEKVKFFYRFDAKNEKKTILWANAVNPEDCVHIDVKNDASFNKETYILNYITDNRTKNITLDRNLVLVYNGSIVNDKVSEIFNMPVYTAKFVKDKSGIYSTAVVEAYENYVVGSIDANKMLIYDKANSQKVLDLDPQNYERLKITVLGQMATTFEEIKKDNILSVYLSKDKKYVNVSVSIDTVSGVAETVKKVSGGKSVLMNAIEYFIPETANGAEVKAGQSVKLYLDTKGEVAYTEVDVSSYTPAYLIDASKKDETFESTLQFRVLTRQGEVKIMDCASTIKIDGKTYKNVEAAAKYIMPGGEFKPQFVMMRVNSSGKITMLDTAADNPDADADDILEVSVPLQGSVIYRSKCLGNKAVLNNNSIIFSLPTKMADAEDKDFSVLTALTDWRTYTDVETYKVQDRIGYEQFVVVHGHNSAMYWDSDIPVLVSYFSDILGEDGEVYEGINGFQGSSEKEFTVKRGVSLQDRGVEEGDVIRLKMNSDGTVDDFTMLYDFDKGGENAIIASFAAQLGFTVGYVTDFVDGVIKIGQTPGTIDVCASVESIPCIIYDKYVSENKIYVGNAASAKTYYNAPAACSMVVLTQSYAVPKYIVIYK